MVYRQLIPLFWLLFLLLLLLSLTFHRDDFAQSFYTFFRDTILFLLFSLVSHGAVLPKVS
ncbi:hypothetical protein HanIR_Chr05g0250851 [Helianthus annuus]|nr:hypothetical protein HanIR_Chr05g0250851 [Helianthus annuus]